MSIVKPLNADGNYKCHPVPEEHVDSLVVVVDGQYTLDGVPVDVAHVLTAHLEVAQSHSWKRHITLIRPVLVQQHVVGHINAECVVLGCEDKVEA